MRLSFLAASLIVLFAGCSSTAPPLGEDAGPDADSDQGADASPDPCVAAASSEFVLGAMELDEPRRFRPFGPGCDTIEIQSGLQGGFHVEPAIQAPSDAVIPDLGGEMSWRILDQNGEQISLEARFELFKSFWQDFGSGYVYWGDFIIFKEYPEDAVDTPLTLELTLDFEEESSFEDQTIRATVILRDEMKTRDATN